MMYYEIVSVVNVTMVFTAICGSKECQQVVLNMDVLVAMHDNVMMTFK